MAETKETSIMINNFKYTIKYVEWNDPNLLAKDNAYRHGLTNLTTKTIYLANDLEAETFQFTLYHEITHAFIDAHGFNQIQWDDEVVADFIGAHAKNIGTAFFHTFNRFMPNLFDALPDADLVLNSFKINTEN